VEKENFLRDYVKLNEGTEIPDLFALWCGIAGISAALGRRVWLDMGTYTIYPNLYVVLVAGSGRCRKSTAVGMIHRLLRQIEPGLNLIAQRITPEAMIESLEVTQVDGEQKFESKTCEGFVVVDELANFLNKKTYESGLASLLITLFDCPERFDYRTRGRGLESIQNACLGLLGASTIDWIRNAIPADAVGSGLTSRILFIYVSKPPEPIAITSFSEEKKSLKESLLKSLLRISTISGPVHLTPNAWDLYKERYESFYQGSEMFENPLLSGYASRRFVHLLKVAICFSVSDETTSKILVDTNHILGAEQMLEDSERRMAEVINLITATEKGAILNLVYSKIRQAGKLSRHQLLRAFSHRLDNRDLTEVLDTLRQSRKIVVSTAGSEIFYSTIS